MNAGRMWAGLVLVTLRFSPLRSASWLAAVCVFVAPPFSAFEILDEPHVLDALLVLSSPRKQMVVVLMKEILVFAFRVSWIHTCIWYAWLVLDYVDVVSVSSLYC